MTLLDAAHTFPSLFAETAQTAVDDTSALLVDAPAVADADGTTPDDGPGFAALGLPSALVRALSRTGITTPFPIQTRHHPRRARRPGRARPRPDRLGQDARVRPADAGPHRRQRPQRRRTAPRAWSWCRRASWPCRSTTRSPRWPKALGLFTKTAFGGAPYSTQIYALERGVDVLVATPGPARRPDRAGRLLARLGRDHGARRGRPDGRHGLPARRHRAAGADARPRASGCCSRPPWTVTSTRWSSGSCTTR